MNPYQNQDPEGEPRYPWEEESALQALHEIYLQAGLPKEYAWKSALADVEHNFGPLTPCAA
jgi:hypothetical protein